MKVCSEDGCDQPVLARGLCSRHYQRWRRGPAKEDVKPGRKPKHSKETREKHGGSPKYLVRMDLQLYEWCQKHGGVGWIRRCLEHIFTNWNDPDFSDTREVLLSEDEPQHFSFEVLAERFGVTRQSLDDWVRARHIPGRRAGQGWKVGWRELEAFETETLPDLRNSIRREAPARNPKWK